MTLQPYWIDSDIEKVWFKANSLPANTTKYFDVRKQGSESPSGDDTFDLFDDFEGSSVDASKWYQYGSTSLTPSQNTVSGGILTTAMQRQPSLTRYMRTASPLGVTDNFVIHARIKTLLETAYNNDRLFISPKNKESTDGDDKVCIYTNLNRLYYDYDDAYTSVSLSSNTWRRCKITYSGGSGTVYLYEDDGTLIASNSGTMADKGDYLYITGPHSYGQFDFIYVTKYASTDPVVNVRDMGSFYRVYVYNPNGDTLTGFQVSVDASDVGVTSASESLEITESVSPSALKYWAEGTSSGDRVFFKVPELKANATHQFAVVKQSGYEPSGEDVFKFFDGFDGSSIDTNKWTSVNGATQYITVSDSVATMNYGSTNSPTVCLKSNNVYGIGDIVEFYMNPGEVGGSGAAKFWGLGNPSTYWYTNTDGWHARNGAWVLLNNGADNSIITNVVPSDYRHYSLTKESADVMRFKLDGSNMASSPLNPTYETDSHIEFHIGISMSIDTVFVRKYASTEPTVTVTDKGSYYLINITNNVAEDLTDYQVYFDATDISLSSVDESLEITEVDYYASNYWIEATDGRTFVKLRELLPFETQIWAIEKVAGYEPSGANVFEYYSEEHIGISGTQESFGIGTACFFRCALNAHNQQCGFSTDGGDPCTMILASTAFSPSIVWRRSAINSASLFNISSTYHTYEIIRANSTTEILYVDGELISTQSSVVSTDALQIEDYGTYPLDFIAVRTYLENEPTVTVEDMGTWYKVLITNNVGETLTDYQVAIPSTDLDITSTTDSLRITQIDHGVSFEPHKDLFEDCIIYLDFMGDDKDVMGNYDGTVTGATLTSDNFGITNAAYSYDGTNDYCALSTIPELQNGSQTFIFKVPPHPSHDTGLIQHRNVLVTLSTLHYMAVLIWTGRDGTGSYIGCNTVMSIDDDVWHIATIGWDVDENYYVIIDGNEVEVTPTSSTSMYSHNYNYLMRWRYTKDDANYYTSGQVALFMMFNTYNKERDLVLNKLLSRGYPYPIMTNTSGGLLE